jgi:hypothetical protein
VAELRERAASTLKAYRRACRQALRTGRATR